MYYAPNDSIRVSDKCHDPDITPYIPETAVLCPVDSGRALSGLICAVFVAPQLHSKGRLKVGACADVLVLAKGDLAPKYVVAKGVVVKAPGWVRGGCFERGDGIRPCPVPTL